MLTLKYGQWAAQEAIRWPMPTNIIYNMLYELKKPITCDGMRAPLRHFQQLSSCTQASHTSIRS